MILVGTMTGTAELVAEELQDALQARGHEVEVRLMDGLGADVFSGAPPCLVVISTYGQGDVPDNTRALVEALERERPDLSRLRYGIIALGDRTYAATYCRGGKQFDERLSALGAKRIGEMLLHDASAGTLPEEVAVEWIPGWMSALEGALAREPTGEAA